MDVQYKKDAAPAPVLAALFTPDAAGEFLHDHWPTRCFHVHGDPGRLPEPFRSRALADFHTLAERYRGRLLFANRMHSPNMIPAERASAADLYNMGLTVYLDDVASCVEGTDRFLGELEYALGISEGSARMGAFASPVTNGVPCHYDVEDVISVQLCGTKRFSVAPVREVRMPYGTQYAPGTRPFDDLYPQIDGDFPDPAGVAFETVGMRPGSVLFMPRGTWHKTEADADSLSVSIVLRPPTVADCALEQLRLLLMQDARWRRPLYGAWGAGEACTHALERAAALLQELPQTVQAIDVDHLLLSTVPERRRVEHIETHTRLQRTPNARLEVVDAGQQRQATVHILAWEEPGRERTTVRMTVAPEAVPVFEWLAHASRPFTAGQLERMFPRFDFAEHRNILAACVRGGLLKLLWYADLRAGNAVD